MCYSDACSLPFPLAHPRQNLATRSGERSHGDTQPRIQRHATTANLLCLVKQPSGRLTVPYVMLYYLPITCNSELRMLYAGAKELMRNTSEVGRIIDMESADELEELPEKLAVE